MQKMDVKVIASEQARQNMLDAKQPGQPGAAPAGQMPAQKAALTGAGTGMGQ